MSIGFDNLYKSCILFLNHHDGTGDFKDISKRHNLGTASGATWSQLANGRWTSVYGGDGDRIQFPKLAFTTALTVIVWWKRAGDSGGATSSTYHAILTALNGYTNNALYVNKAGTIITVDLYIAAASKTTTMACNASAWNQIGMVWDGATLRPIVNGELGSSVAAVGALSDDANFTISGRYAANYYYANGNMWGHSAYTVALTATQIRQLYEYEKGWFGL